MQMQRDCVTLPESVESRFSSIIKQSDRALDVLDRLNRIKKTITPNDRHAFANCLIDRHQCQGSTFPEGHHMRRTIAWHLVEGQLLPRRPLHALPLKPTQPLVLLEKCQA
ncbi:hypothetical protein TNCV_2479631 [Trichonephila clavipes]|nr:hypothetical protein TNCV_2479631 [Trichonephila clavipes]